jgi:N-acetylglucosamine-6-sulfatase
VKAPSLLVACCLLLSSTLPTRAGTADASPVAQKRSGPPNRPGLPPPNIVFIITDDQEIETLAYMPRLQAVLADQGVTFTNMFVTEPQCCPSHVSILTGQYPHNTGVLNNFYPTGGWQKFFESGGESSTLATWLQDAGYATGRFGKYLVEYPDDSTHVPPGWNEWHVQYGGFGQYFNYSLNENGTVVRYGSAPSDYSADVLTGKVVEFIDRAEVTDDAQPFFVFFAPSAPHGDGVPNGRATPAPRHKGMFQGKMAPRPPSFNEADVSDKPAPVRDLPPLTAQQIAGIDIEYQTRLEALQAVDEGIERIVKTLAERGELENTYIFFTSDNGYHLGQHRFVNGKFQVYEEDIRVPLVVRGPGVRRGATRDHFVLNIDFAPTIAELAGIQPGHAVDGRSLVPLFGRKGPRGHGSRMDDPLSARRWRQDFLVEIYRRSPPLGNGDAIRALRTRDAVYVEYASGPRELYDLRADPFQLENVHDAAPPGRLRRLSRRLAELATCAGDTCRGAGDEEDDKHEGHGGR